MRTLVEKVARAYWMNTHEKGANYRPPFFHDAKTQSCLGTAQ